MSSAEQFEFIPVESYLERESIAPSKSEYVDGWMRAMTGASNRHNLLATNICAILWNQLKGKHCQSYNSDTKIRIQRGSSTWFYYPDVSVVCDENPQSDSFQENPVLVVEVLSRSTRAADLDEKLANYLTIPALHYCLILEQTEPRAILMRRTQGGSLREIHEGLNATICLEAIDCRLPLAEIYARVDFSPEAIREEESVYVSDNVSGSIS